MSKEVDREKEIDERRRQRRRRGKRERGGRERKKKPGEAAVVVAVAWSNSKRDKFDAFPSNSSIFRSNATSRDAARIGRGFLTKSQQPIAKEKASFRLLFLRLIKKKKRARARDEGDDFLFLRLRFSASSPLAFQVRQSSPSTPTSTRAQRAASGLQLRAWREHEAPRAARKKGPKSSLVNFH